MTPPRKAFLELVADEATSKPRLLGALLTYMRDYGTEAERRLSDACDRAFKAEFERIKAERLGAPPRTL